jgi:DNA mismatch repair protein MutS2
MAYNPMGQDPLEYSVLKKYIAPYLASEVGASALESLRPLDNWEEAGLRLRLTSEMMAAMDTDAPVTIPLLPDIRPLLQVKEGAVLEGQDLLKVSQALHAVADLKRALEAKGGPLAELVRPMDALARVAAGIDSTILPTGEVSGDAYPELRDLRNRARALRAAVVERLEGILDRLRPRSVLMEDLVTLRNDRYVIPLRHDFQTHIQGITHDYSRTNRTVFVEPMEVVEENNELSRIRARIAEEEQRVLRELTSLVLAHADAVGEDLRIYGDVDLLAACARWALKWGCTIPAMGGAGTVLRQARHPILLERLGEAATVPLDILVPEGCDCLLITGPNAGGKTVALKTLGLIVLMAKSGLAVPAAEGSGLKAVGEVRVEMDTAQDITHDLSSFTAQALALKEIYEKTTEGDLVLLDEPGSGTDHEQGSALAVACIHALRAKGATVVVTSHSDLVKLYGATSRGVVNAAAAFDETGMRPLYTLQYGVIGQSRAFEILEAIDFPRDLIVEARGIVNRDETSTLARALQDISLAGSMKAEAARELEEAVKARREAEIQLEEYRKERLQASLRYRRLLDRLEAMARKAPRPEEVRRLRSSPETLEMERVIEEAGVPASALDVVLGARVRLEGSDREGVVVDVGRDSAEVAVGGKRFRVALDQITAVTADRGDAVGPVIRMQAPSRVLPIKVVGLRVDEALPIVERALDRAMLAGQDRVEIIHGTGTGRLRNAIRSYLRGLAFVEEVADAPMDEGGGNKTIVVLRGG